MKILMPGGEKHIVIIELQTSEEELEKNGWIFVKSDKENHRFYVHFIHLIHGMSHYLVVDDKYRIISKGICRDDEVNKLGEKTNG